MWCATPNVYKISCKKHFICVLTFSFKLVLQEKSGQKIHPRSAQTMRRNVDGTREAWELGLGLASWPCGVLLVHILLKHVYKMCLIFIFETK